MFLLINTIQIIMQKKPQISIILPMYNAENTIEKCLDSLLNQSIQPIEIIIIDDKSEDKCCEIVAKYSKKTKNIVFLKNEKNIGAGASKNRGLKVAQADLIGFIDADDFVGSTYYENMVVAIKKFDADIVCSDIALVYDDHIDYSYLLKDNLYAVIKETNCANFEDSKLISSEVATAHWGAASAPSKIFRKDIIGCFYEGTCDDIMFTFPALARASRIAYVYQNFYMYVQREGSLERRDFCSSRLTLADCLSKTTELIGFDTQKNMDMLKLIYAYSAWPILLDILSFGSDRMINLQMYRLKLKYQDFLINNSYLKANLFGKAIGEQLYILDLIEKFHMNKFEEMCQLYDEFNNNSIFYLPRVSIVIPVFNGSNYLKEAIESALMQSYPNLEIIVVNDGSSDKGETEKIALSFGKRIKYYSKKNGGVASALNYGIEHMTGEYFSWLSHDDLYKKDKVLRQIEELRGIEDKRTIIVCGYEVVNKYSERLYDVNLLDLYTKVEVERPLFAVFRGGINGCATLIHKSHFEREGKFDISLPTTQDYDLWFRIMRGQKICYMHENLVLSRCHEEQDSKKLYDKHLIECNKLWIGLIKQLSAEEMCIISGSPFCFYRAEKDFFQQTHYKKVVGYLDGKILDILQSSLQEKNKHTMRLLEAMFDLPISFLKLEIFTRNISLKYAIIISEKTIENEAVWETAKIIEKSCTKNNLVFVVPTERVEMFEWSEGNNVIRCPIKKIDSIPFILKLVSVKLCIISDRVDCKQESLYSICSAMGIETIALNLRQHWIFRKDAVHSRILQIEEENHADLIVWTDEKSQIVDSLRNTKAVYIPLCLPGERSEQIAWCWKNIIEGEYDLLTAPFHDKHIFELLYDVVVASDECLNQCAKEVIKEPLVVERIIHKESDEDWEERYNGIANSTCWKLLSPVRLLADKIKALKK